MSNTSQPRTGQCLEAYVHQQLNSPPRKAKKERVWEELSQAINRRKR